MYCHRDINLQLHKETNSKACLSSVTPFLNILGVVTTQLPLQPQKSEIHCIDTRTPDIVRLSHSTSLCQEFAAVSIACGSSVM